MNARPLRRNDARVRIAKPIVVAVLSLASAVAVAQIRPDAGQILEQQREPLRLPPPADDDIRPRLPEPKPALPVSPTLKVTVTQFNFSGNTLYTDEHLREVVQEFVGKELDFEGLNDAATKVRAYHRERGYFLAQAYLPQQAIRDGVVEIAVIEGRVGQVELQRRPATRLREGLMAGILSHHLKPGDIITETSLEKPLLLINDLPTAAVTSEIRPSQTIGAADLRVNVDQTCASTSTRASGCSTATSRSTTTAAASPARSGSAAASTSTIRSRSATSCSCAHSSRPRTCTSSGWPTWCRSATGERGWAPASPSSATSWARSSPACSPAVMVW
jgi:hemolysin activation/secretion protein